VAHNWANKVLKDYLLRGYAVTCNQCKPVHTYSRIAKNNNEKKGKIESHAKKLNKRKR